MIKDLFYLSKAIFTLPISWTTKEALNIILLSRPALKFLSFEITISTDIGQAPMFFSTQIFWNLPSNVNCQQKSLD